MNKTFEYYFNKSDKDLLILLHPTNDLNKTKQLNVITSKVIKSH